MRGRETRTSRNPASMKINKRMARYCSIRFDFSRIGEAEYVVDGFNSTAVATYLVSIVPIAREKESTNNLVCSPRKF
jgi:hypothetical protein